MPANANHVRFATNHVNPENPVFARNEDTAPMVVSPGQAEYAQMGKIPLPSTQSPLLNEPIAEAGTVYLDSQQKPIGVSDGVNVVPIDLEKSPRTIGVIGGTPATRPPTDEEDEDDQVPVGVGSAVPPQYQPSAMAPEGVAQQAGEQQEQRNYAAERAGNPAGAVPFVPAAAEVEQPVV
jgi:hypothetical protein